MATDIKGGKMADVYQRFFFRSTTSDISTGTNAQYLATSVQSSGTSVDSVLSVGTERVGVGTASPSQLLHISGASDPAILITDTTSPCSLIMISQNTSASVGTTTAHSLTLNTNNSAKMTIESGGNIGIGTTGPDSKLDILDASNPQLRLTHTDGSKYVTLQVDTNHDLLVKPSSTGQVKFQPTTDSTDFFQVYDANGGTPVLNVDSTNERIGVGTASPSSILDVSGTITATDLILSDATNPAITITDTTTPTTLAISSGDTYSSIGTVTSHELRIMTANSQRAVFTSAGKVGIGVASPVSTLDVEGNVSIGASYSGTSAAPGNGVIIEGSVGINTINPDAQITVSGGEGGNGVINLWADDGDDNADKWRSTADTSGNYNIESYSTGSWVNLLQVAPAEVKLGTNLNMNGNALIGGVLTSGVSFQLTDADVVHGVTNVAPTDVYGDFGTIHGTQGGLYINGISDQESASARSLALRGICNDTHTDTVPTVEIIGAKRSGTSVQALTDDEIVLEVANHTSSLMTVNGEGVVKGTDFYIQQQVYSRQTASNVSILSGADTSNAFDTGATSTTSIDAEGALRGMAFFATYDTEIVKVTAIMGSAGTVEDLNIYIMVSDAAVTADLDGALAFTVLSTLTQAGALTTDKAYFVTDAPGATIGNRKFILIGCTISSGTNQYVSANITLQMRTVV